MSNSCLAHFDSVFFSTWFYKITIFVLLYNLYDVFLFEIFWVTDKTRSHLEPCHLKTIARFPLRQHSQDVSPEYLWPHTCGDGGTARRQRRYQAQKPGFVSLRPGLEKETQLLSKVNVKGQLVSRPAVSLEVTMSVSCPTKNGDQNIRLEPRAKLTSCSNGVMCALTPWTKTRKNLPWIQTL